MKNDKILDDTDDSIEIVNDDVLSFRSNWRKDQTEEMSKYTISADIEYLYE
jgi:hypothetical protein